jgi:glycosyltransferase involved in cell wall biosynthesis
VSEPVPSVGRKDVRRAFGLADEVGVIVMTSRFERWKGHETLLRAAAALDGDWELWIAGIPQRPHEQEYEQELRQLARTLGLTARVRFLQDRVNVPDLLGAADIHCQPNSSPEPFGIALVEALYARVPVVTSNAGGAAEIVTPECGVLVAMGDVDALTLALQTLLRDPKMRSSLGAAGPARARSLCDPARRVPQLESALAETVETAQ